MEERQTEACPVSLSLIFKKYTELHWTNLRLKYTCTNGYYLNILRTKRVRGIVELTSSNFSHASRNVCPCKMHKSRYNLNTVYKI